MHVILEINIFTESALCADSAYYPPYLSVCLFVCPSVKKSRIWGTPNLSTDADSSTTTFFRSFYSGYCRFWTSSHQGDRVLMAVRNTFSLQVMDLFSILIKETVRRLKVIVQVISLISVQSSHQGYKVMKDQ